MSDLFPNQVGTIWLSADLFGVIASLVLAKRKRTHKGIGQSVAWRLGGMAASIGLFAFCTLLVFEVRSGRQITCYFGLMVACGYSIAGCWSGLRWLIAGVVMGVLTLSGYFMLPEHYNLWMGCVGGGTLALTGVWMRRV